MNFKSYPNKANTKSRKTRKSMRLGVFSFNKKLKKQAKKAARIARRIAD